MRAFSTFRILPRSGSTAWKRRSRPCLALPPAESPSTMNSSHRAGSRSWQSASLPGSAMPSKAPLRTTRSRAFCAATRARAASNVFSMMRRASEGCSCRNVLSFSLTTDCTCPATSLLPSRCFVCPSNWGSGIMMLITAVRPSRTSSPVKLASLSLSVPCLRAYSLSVRVRAVRNPVRCVPPLMLRMVLANVSTCSATVSQYCREMSILVVSTSPLMPMGSGCSGVRRRASSLTNDCVPPSK